MGAVNDGELRVSHRWSGNPAVGLSLVAERVQAARADSGAVQEAVAVKSGLEGPSPRSERSGDLRGESPRLGRSGVEGTLRDEALPRLLERFSLGAVLGPAQP